MRTCPYCLRELPVAPNRRTVLVAHVCGGIWKGQLLKGRFQFVYCDESSFSDELDRRIIWETDSLWDIDIQITGFANQVPTKGCEACGREDCDWYSGVPCVIRSSP